MAEPDFERPPVYVDERGIFHVRPADIFRSRAGQEAIRRTAALRCVLRHEEGAGGPQASAAGPSAAEGDTARE